MSSEQESALSQLIVGYNEKLEHIGQSTTNQAFNLGCTVGFIPGVVIILITGIFTRGSIPSILISTGFVLISMLIFASLVAFQARKRTLDRVFKDQLRPDIIKRLGELNISSTVFEEFAIKSLPQNSLLLKYMIPVQSEALVQPEIDSESKVQGGGTDGRPIENQISR